MEQQQECYGIPYAMHVHDIESLESVGLYEQDKSGGAWKNMVNKRLEEGWRVLHLFSDPDNEPRAIMGVPRDKYCTGSQGVSHEKVVKKWEHNSSVWYCPKCTLVAIEGES